MKRSAVDGESFLRIHGEKVPAMKIGDRYKYLGLQTGDTGYRVELSTKLNQQIERVTQARLYPQQRMEVLRQSILPGLFHQLVLGGMNRLGLRSLDVIVRRAVRKWLHLPQDTP